MEFYLEALDRQERMEGENSPIGMIVCRYKNKMVVEYALRTASRPIGVATYTIVSRLPEGFSRRITKPGGNCSTIESVGRRKRMREIAQTCFQVVGTLGRTKYLLPLVQIKKNKSPTSGWRNEK